MEWPQGWETLRDAMTARVQDRGQPPSVPPDSILIEFPVFDNSRHDDDSRTELGWMIFEVSEDYFRGKTLPRLVAQDLSSGTDAIYDVSVSWVDPGQRVIFSTRADKSRVADGADATTGIFSSDIAGGRGARPRWTLAVRHHEARWTRQCRGHGL